MIKKNPQSYEIWYEIIFDRCILNLNYHQFFKSNIIQTQILIPSKQIIISAYIIASDIVKI